MVLCKFFQQGNCRFGTKCNNEHFDVKQIIKADVEAAINGNQWPISCFGPFKDKPSIPNFIEDQSFEEIRYLCYESKQKNFFDQFHQQFSKEALEAKNKLKALLQLTPEVIDVVSKVYDAPLDGASGLAAAAKPNNPFGMASNNQPGASVFGKPAASATTGGNVFGGFAAAPAAPNAGGSIFGGANNSAPAGGGLFGPSAGSTFNNAPAQQTSIFGQQAKTGNSIFGGGTQTSIFGQQQQNVATGGGLFAQAAKPQPVAGGGLFAQAAAQTAQQQQPGLGLFAQAAQQNPFGQQQQHQQQQPQPGAGIFAQAAQQQQQQQQPNAFTQQQQPQNMASGGGIFGAAASQTQNIFSQQQQQQQAGPFGQNTQQQQQPQATGFFQQQSQTPFMSQAQPPAAAQAATAASTTIYSRMEDLTAAEIEAFKADSFTVGNIPFSPPPRELVH